MSAGTTPPPGTLYGRSAPPDVSLVPPPVAVPPFAAVRLGSGGLRQRLTALCAHQRRRVLLCLVVLIAALSLPLLGRVAQAPEGASPTAADSGAGPDGGGGAEADGASGSPRASEPPAAGAGAAADARGGADAGAARAPARLVSAPVRIADADAVRLLRPGDRVDVLASPTETATSARARVVAHRARVTKLPSSRGNGARDKEISEAGALVVLAVPPSTARDLAGAGAHSQLAVTVW